MKKKISNSNKTSQAKILKNFLLTLVEVSRVFWDSLQWPHWKGAEKRAMGQVLYRMKKERLVEMGEENGKTTVKITEKGKRRVLKYKFEELEIKKSKSWDKKWRIIIFDIPNKKRSARDALRRKLKELGFYKLQESVFIYPYECKNELDFICKVYEIKPFVKYILAEEIEEVERIFKYFDL